MGTLHPRWRLCYALIGQTIYIKYKHIFRITLSVHTNLSPSCIRYFITIEFIYLIFTPYTTYSTHLFRRGMARSMSLRSGTGQDDHRLGGRTTYRMDFTANQLVGLLGAHSCSVFTLLPTSWLNCSSHGLHRQLCWGLVSYAGNSLVFGFFMQASPAKLGTP